MSVEIEPTWHVLQYIAIKTINPYAHHSQLRLGNHSHNNIIITHPRPGNTVRCLVWRSIFVILCTELPMATYLQNSTSCLAIKQKDDILAEKQMECLRQHNDFKKSYSKICKVQYLHITYSDCKKLLAVCPTYGSYTFSKYIN